jgi:hypothetical protein
MKSPKRVPDYRQSKETVEKQAEIYKSQTILVQLAVT